MRLWRGLRPMRLAREMAEPRIQENIPDKLWGRFIREGTSLLLWTMIIWMFVWTLGG